MPILNYKKIAEQREKNFFQNSNISNTNKEYIRKFLDSYDVSDARLDIFLSHIEKFLPYFDDIRADLTNRDKVNSVYKSLRDTLSTSYYSTIVNVSLRFVRWLNDGERPKGFTDIKSPSKKKVKRDLDPNDMVTWEDGLNMLNYTRTIQFKAIILTQLDGGFRPSEFYDLNYGDITIKKPFIIVNVKDGKTGKRIVTLFKSVPYLQDWLNSHPTKKEIDPLWISENDKDIQRYKYPAMAKRVKEIGAKAGIKKPLDFYNLRHSACTIAKKDNMPVELAQKKFGHSADYFLNTYGRLTIDEDLTRHADHLGYEDNKKKKDLNVYCKTCDKVNPPNTEICIKCSTPLTIEAALNQKSDKDKEFDKLKDEMRGIKDMLKKMALEGKIKP